MENLCSTAKIGQANFLLVALRILRNGNFGDGTHFESLHSLNWQQSLTTRMAPGRSLVLGTWSRSFISSYLYFWVCYTCEWEKEWTTISILVQKFTSHALSFSYHAVKICDPSPRAEFEFETIGQSRAGVLESGCGINVKNLVRVNNIILICNLVFSICYLHWCLGSVIWGSSLLSFLNLRSGQ